VTPDLVLLNDQVYELPVVHSLREQGAVAHEPDIHLDHLDAAELGSQVSLRRVIGDLEMSGSWAEWHLVLEVQECFGELQRAVGGGVVPLDRDPHGVLRVEG